MPIGPKTASVPDCMKSEAAVRKLVESTRESTMLRAVLAVVAHGAANAKTAETGRELNRSVGAGTLHSHREACMLTRKREQDQARLCISKDPEGWPAVK